MKTCIMCPNKIPVRHKLCSTCYKQYKDYMYEDWFIELTLLQRKQDDIDRRESNLLNGSTGVTISGNASDNIVSSKKSVGRPSTDWKLVNEVLTLYDLSIERELDGTGKRLSLRALQTQMRNKVKYLTVRRILRTYRNDTYPNKKITVF